MFAPVAESLSILKRRGQMKLKALLFSLCIFSMLTSLAFPPWSQATPQQLREVTGEELKKLIVQALERSPQLRD
jgi:hypothetical protein